jgi:bifunctional non-homologous end joining protein LigD
VLDRPLDPCGLQIEPLALVPHAEPFDGPDWLFEPKYDGLRGLLHATATGCDLRSRRNFRADRFAELRERIAGVLGGRDAILDGEVVALDRQGRPVFRDLLRGRGFLAFAAFDLLRLDGRDLRSLPLSERKARLAGLLPNDTGPLYKVLTIDEYGRALFEAAKKLDLPGIVAKRKSDPYGPDTRWYRIENPGYTSSEGRAGLFRRTARSRRTEKSARR